MSYSVRHVAENGAVERGIGRRLGYLQQAPPKKKKSVHEKMQFEDVQEVGTKWKLQCESLPTTHLIFMCAICMLSR